MYICSISNIEMFCSKLRCFWTNQEIDVLKSSVQTSGFDNPTFSFLLRCPTAIFCTRIKQVFVSCRLLDKNLLEWFLIIICKGHNLTRSTNLLSRNHPTLCFLITERRSADAQYWTVTLSNWQKQPPGCSKKKLFLKFFAISTRKHLCWRYFFVKLQTFRPATLLKRDSNKGALLLRNF